MYIFESPDADLGVTDAPGRIGDAGAGLDGAEGTRTEGITMVIGVSSSAMV